MYDEEITRDTRAIIDLDGVRKSVSGIRKLVGNGVEIMAVVKADGYGHGAIKVAKKSLDSGADSLAVAYPREGKELRGAGIDAPILVMGLTPPEGIETVVKLGLAQAVADTDGPMALNNISSRDKKSPIHIKVDTGMGRLGIRPDELFGYLEFLSGLENIDIEGIFTHFPSADEADTSFTKKQIDIFKALLSEIDNRGIKITKRHIANSAGILAYPDSYLNVVRPGIILYGLYPSEEVIRTIKLTPVMSLVTKVRYMKRARSGTPISYGRTYVTRADTIVATLPVGYADGYPRILSNRGEVLIRGKRAKIIGRVCMDMTMVDVTHIPDVKVGDEVVLFGRQGDGEISTDEVARWIGTINYEVTSIMGKRVPRVYLNE